MLRSSKSEQLTTEFTQTEAYSQLFMELASDAEAAAAFINGIIPNDIDINDPKLKDEVTARIEQKDA